MWASNWGWEGSACTYEEVSQVSQPPATTATTPIATHWRHPSPTLRRLRSTATVFERVNPWCMLDFCSRVINLENLYNTTKHVLYYVLWSVLTGTATCRLWGGGKAATASEEVLPSSVPRAAWIYNLTLLKSWSNANYLFSATQHFSEVNQAPSF